MREILSSFILNSRSIYNSQTLALDKLNTRNGTDNIENKTKIKKN